MHTDGDRHPVAMLLNMLMYKLNKTPLVGMGYG